MARGKKEGAEPKPEKKAESISLLRLEERHESVAITAEQAHERMKAAAGVIQEALVLDREHAELAAAARTKKKQAEAKHEEADRIVLEAQHGTVRRAYPVIVERHPTRPHTMLVWRTPDGVAPADLMGPEVCEGLERIAAREAQGCILLEERAMFPEELDVAALVDKHPPLPGLNTTPPPAGQPDPIVEPVIENPPAPAIDAVDPPPQEASVEDAEDEPAAGEDDDDGPPEEVAEDHEDEIGDSEEAPPAAVATVASPPPEPPANINTNVLARVRIALNNTESLSMERIVDLTQHHADDVRPVIAYLVARGEIERTGKGRGTKYGRPVAAAAG